MQESKGKAMLEFEKNDTDFTARAKRSIQKTTETPQFEEYGSDSIFKTLEKELASIRFGDYLKRYIHRKAQIDMPYEQVPISEYQQIVIDAFEDSRTPFSLEPVTTKRGAIVKNWLTQKNVKRNAVFLLGFGLSMTVEEVNEFLEKGLKERGIYPKDPFEVICWYCYKNGFGYAKYEKLWEEYQTASEETYPLETLYEDKTMNVRNMMYQIEDDATLMAYLCQLKKGQIQNMSVTAREWFDKLYAECRELTAEYLNESEMVEEICFRNKEEKRKLTAQDVTAGDIEHVIYAAIPQDEHGNLRPDKESLLSEQFGGKRFSRQRISEIQNQKKEVERFDLITLYFYIEARKLENDFEDTDRKAQMRKFTISINKILEECQMWPLYLANPYESFIYMCLQTEYPLDTYSDIWERAYE